MTDLSMTLYYGYIEANGDVLFQVLWDPRVTDGQLVRRMLDELEHTLNNDIVTELQAGSPATASGELNSKTSTPNETPA